MTLFDTINGHLKTDRKTKLVKDREFSCENQSKNPALTVIKTNLTIPKDYLKTLFYLKFRVYHSVNIKH